VAVRLGPELAFQLHKAPDPGAVGAEVGLDVGGRLTDGGQVDARAAPRTAPAAPQSAGPGPGRAKSPPEQATVAPSLSVTRKSVTSPRVESKTAFPGACCVVETRMAG
jgi:hypothetical protein